MKLAPRVAVVGEGDASKTITSEAEEVGREIALRGGILICGGLGGVMEAAARGCKSAGGITIGVMPGADAEDANPHIAVPIVTGMGEGRNIIVVRSAQVVIAIGGSYGTLSEIALALRLNIPVIGLHTWIFSRGQPKERDPVIRAANAKEAVDQAWSALRDQ